MTLRQYLIKIWNNYPVPESRADLKDVDEFKGIALSGDTIYKIINIIHCVSDHTSNSTQSEKEIKEILREEDIRRSREYKKELRKT